MLAYGDLVGFGSVPVTEPRVPHISLVFREMWDTTVLDLRTSRPQIKIAVSHISRKTSEMWGTHRFRYGRKSKR